MTKLLMIVGLAISFAACGGGGGDDGGGDAPSFSSGNISSRGIVASGTTGPTGSGEIGFDLAPDASSFQLQVSSSSPLVRVVRVIGPTAVIFDAASSPGLSGASQFQPSPVAFNFPIVPTGPLVPGRYRVVVETAQRSNRMTGGADVSLKLITKQDQDMRSGVLTVNLIYSGAAVDATILRIKVRETQDDVRAFLARMGIGVEFREVEFRSGPSILPDPFAGDVFYAATTGELPAGVNIFIGADVRGLRAPESRFSRVGGVPTPLNGTNRSAIALSLSAVAGNDGEIDSTNLGADATSGEEQRLLKESMVHDILNALGVPDTVTFAGSNVVNTDQLDSPKCVTLRACEGDGNAKNNIMFPFALRDPMRLESGRRRVQRRGGARAGPTAPGVGIEFFKRVEFSPMQAVVAAASTAVR